ncbi:MAG: nucleotidyltransferase domain-containing protein [Nanoarchaeota archaeon]|nr:nucleotidyltransferase domain-containing protein [Nanoarchaeota archaeon]
MGQKTDQIVSSFVEVVKENIPSCKIWFFGSRAQGKGKKDSDYDFLLVSPEFTNVEWEERSAKVYYLKRKIPAAMDIICLTPQEFKKKKKFGVIQEAVREGKLLSSAK